MVYFDIFHYPVSKEEIRLFMDHPVEDDELAIALQKMVDDACIFRHDEFYLLRDDYCLVERRRKGFTRAQPLLATAQRISALLYRFPYVRGIGISGSLSKSYADDKADIDYFIITKSNRLWIARTFMHIFKKFTFVAGRQHWFCMNYFVDEDALEIEEKNIFTAIELVTLLPVCGNGSLIKFFTANDWARLYYPNQTWRMGSVKATGFSWIKKFTEDLFNNRLGDHLDNYFLQLTTRRWNKKEAHLQLNARGIQMGLKNGKHYSKPNPAYFQDKIVALYFDKLKALNI